MPSFNSSTKELLVAVSGMKTRCQPILVERWFQSSQQIARETNTTTPKALFGGAATSPKAIPGEAHSAGVGISFWEKLAGSVWGSFFNEAFQCGGGGGAASSAPLVAAAAGADGSGELRKRKGAAAVARSARGSSELRKLTHGSF